MYKYMCQLTDHEQIFVNFVKHIKKSVYFICLIQQVF